MGKEHSLHMAAEAGGGEKPTAYKRSPTARHEIRGLDEQCLNAHASGWAREPRRDSAATPSRPSRSTAQTIPRPRSSLLPSCQLKMPTSRTCDAGSPDA